MATTIAAQCLQTVTGSQSARPLRTVRRRSQYAVTASSASSKETSGVAPIGMTEHPPPELCLGVAEPETVACASFPPPDKPSETVPL